jgi:hypothetical protein
MFGDLSHQFGIELQPITGRGAEKVPHFIKGDATSPGEKISIPLKLRKLPPQEQAAPLKDIFRIRVMGKQGIYVSRQTVSIARIKP